MSEIVHAPENEAETMCGLPVWEAPFAGNPKHVTCSECLKKHPELGDRRPPCRRGDTMSKQGRLVGYGGAVWIEGDGWSTEPGWIGPLKTWKARRYAKRNGISLVNRQRCECGAPLVDDGNGWLTCERGHYERTPESRAEMAEAAESRLASDESANG